MNLLANLWQRFLGRFPPAQLAALEAEGMEFVDTGIWISLTLKNWKSPGGFASYRCSGGFGGVALTRRRLVISHQFIRVDELTVAQLHRPGVTLKLVNPRCLHLILDAASFQPSNHGTATLSLRSSRSTRLFQAIENSDPNTRSK